MENEEVVIGGIYKHFKGNKYKILAVGKNSETMEEIVVYQALYDSEEFGNNAIWVRPKKMFLENVERDGRIFKRFEYIE